MSYPRTISSEFSGTPPPHMKTQIILTLISKSTERWQQRSIASSTVDIRSAERNDALPNAIIGKRDALSCYMNPHVKGSVYSATSAEIMWTRPTTDGLSYEISRNGSVVTTTTGISYYDKSLSAGTSYTYKIIAIDRHGDRSIVEPGDVYTRDAYGLADVIRVDVRTETTPGVCTADDLSGCTLADVMADIDKTDDLTVAIPIHVSAGRCHW